MRILPFAAAAGLCFSGALSAQVTDSTSLSDTASLADYMDKFVDKDMQELHVPGAVVAIVHKDRVVLLRGYGLANIEKKTPVDPYRTIFRAGSVTKPFTAVAVMQLMEHGKLAPDVDVNRYMKDMQVPAAFQKPVTISELLTHTAGFDVELAGTAARTEREVQPLGRFLRTYLPPRVNPPGELIAYSNHGFTLLGHIVEQLSGETYAGYMKRHVLDPLGMTSSTMQFTPDVEARAATPYEPRSLTAYRIPPPLHPNISPAASLNTTASDMSKFMLMMLHGGVIDSSRVLDDSTVRAMLATHFTQDPRMPGVAWGFFESNWHNRRMVFHSGGIRGFMSAVYLFPDDSIGLFVADNGYQGDFIYDVLFHFMDRYLAATPPLLRPNPSDASRLRKYAGFYRDANHTVTSLEKAGGIRNNGLEIRVTDSGAVTAFGVQFVQTGPRFFRERKGWETLAFLEDPKGDVTGVVTTYPFPGTQVWKRIPFLATGVPSQIVMIWTLILSVFLLARPPRLRSGKNWAEREMVIPSRMIEWSGHTAWMVRGLALTQLMFLILMWLGARSTGGMLYGVPWQMDAAGVVAVVGALALLVLIVRLGKALLHSDWPRAKLAPLAGIVFSSALFLLLQYYWNLLGINH